MFVTIQSTELLSLGEAAYEFKAKLTRANWEIWKYGDKGIRE